MITHGELFAGISGFGLGYAQAGIETSWHVEIDSKCQDVLKRHYPNTVLLSDVRDCGAHNLTPVDIISFGSPCQDLSVAGKRKGLIDGEKSSLFFEAIRIVGELKPTFGVWENVPGAFSSNSGRDFATVLSAFRDIGARDIAWTVLDAQYFGVAQRRRRIFLVADFRGERAAEILFESSRSAWDTAPSREEGQGVARDAAASIGIDSETNADRELIGTIRSHKSGGSELMVAHSFERRGGFGRTERQGMTGTLQSEGGKHQGAPCRLPIVSFPGMAQGGAGWAPPSMPVEEDMTGTIDATRAHCVAYGVSENQRSEVRLTEYSRQITSGGGKPGQGYPCALVSPTIGADIGRQAGGHPGIEEYTAAVHAAGFGVRRLTPTECEKLQGFPTGWTAGQSDTQRYRQLGNAVAVPCAKWIGQRIVRVYDS